MALRGFNQTVDSSWEVSRQNSRKKDLLSGQSIECSTFLELENVKMSERKSIARRVVGFETVGSRPSLEVRDLELPGRELSCW